MRSAKGTDGVVELVGDDVVLTFGGLAADPVKKAVSPRRVPLRAISAVELVEPKGMRTGALRLVLAGQADAERTSPAKDINAVQSNAGKSSQALREMAEHLRTLIAGVEAVPLHEDPSTVPAPAAQVQAAYADYVAATQRMDTVAKWELRFLTGSLVVMAGAILLVVVVLLLVFGTIAL